MAETVVNVEKPATLIAAIVAAQKHAKAVGLDGYNQHANYAYASAENLITEAKECLALFGLGLLPTKSEIIPAHEAMVAGSALSNGSLVLGIARFHWLLVHEAGQSESIVRDWPIVQAKGRPADKAMAGADTAALGYLLRDLLQLPRVEEGTGLDDSARDAPEATPGKGKEAPPKREPKPPMDAAKSAASAAAWRALRDGIDGMRSAPAVDTLLSGWLETKAVDLDEAQRSKALEYVEARKLAMFTETVPSDQQKRLMERISKL